jgi:hypothetical protein
LKFKNKNFSQGSTLGCWIKLDFYKQISHMEEKPTHDIQHFWISFSSTKLDLICVKFSVFEISGKSTTEVRLNEQVWG